MAFSCLLTARGVAPFPQGRIISNQGTLADSSMNLTSPTYEIPCYYFLPSSLPDSGTEICAWIDSVIALNPSPNWEDAAVPGAVPTFNWIEASCSVENSFGRPPDSAAATSHSAWEEHNSTPECLDCPRVPFPQVALFTNGEGVVWLNVLVDYEGKVREARIAKSSRSKMGFDEYAVTAALKNVFRPAIRNDRPVVVWITYPLTFRILHN